MGSCVPTLCSCDTNIINRNKDQSVSQENERMPRVIQDLSTKDRRVSEEYATYTREEPNPSFVFSIFKDSGLEGGISYIYHWRKENATLSNSEIVIAAVNGILKEGRLIETDDNVEYVPDEEMRTDPERYKVNGLGRSTVSREQAEHMAQLLLDVKDKDEKDILKRCIFLYTMDTFLYKLVNGVLNDNDKTKMDTVAPFCYFLTEAIWSDRLAGERFYGTVYRGIKLDKQSIESYKDAIGTYKYWYSFISTSKALNVAKVFGNCIFYIDVSAAGGLSVSSYSEFPDENEVILPPGITLRIDRVEEIDERMCIFLFVVPEFRLVELGRTGSGKSALGNTILGKSHFKAKISAKSVTTQCQVSDRIFCDARLLVVDTPGFFDTQLRPADVIPEISRSYQVAAPGPHAFLVVFQIGRFTEEEKAVAKWICEVFDERALDYCIIVFTSLDNLNREEQTIEEYLKEIPDFLTEFLNKCNSRYIAVDNTASADEKEKLVINLLDKIKKMVKNSGGQFYNNKSFIEITKVLNKTDPDWSAPSRSNETADLIPAAEDIVGTQLKSNTLLSNP